MELDDFKEGLKLKLDETSSSKDNVDLQDILHSKTKTTLEKLKRSFWFEMGYGLIIGIGLSAWFYFHEHRYYHEIGKVILPISATALVLIMTIYFRITSTISAEKPILSNLKATAHLLNSFIKTYFWTTIVLLPTAIIYCVWLTLQLTAQEVTLLEKDFVSIDTGNSGLDLSIILAVVALYLYGAYKFTRWYLKKLYGNYLKELQSQIKDLEGE